MDAPARVAAPPVTSGDSANPPTTLWRDPPGWRGTVRRTRRAAIQSSRRALDRVLGARTHDRVDACTRWIELVKRFDGPLVSVITPTYRRPDRLRRAIDSLVAQRHEAWEQIVVEDGGPADAEHVVAAVDDPRVRYSFVPKSGPADARNRGLELARGAIVTYLDDDNVMHPLWLHGVVWAFDRFRSADVLYGAHLRCGDWSGFPYLLMPAWDRAAHVARCVIDMNVLAHRSGLPEARFDTAPELRGFEDWEMSVRLTRSLAPITLPLVAVHYIEDASQRMMLRDDYDGRFGAAQRIIAARDLEWRESLSFAGGRSSPAGPERSGPGSSRG